MSYGNERRLLFMGILSYSFYYALAQRLPCRGAQPTLSSRTVIPSRAKEERRMSIPLLPNSLSQKNGSTRKVRNIIPLNFEALKIKLRAKFCGKLEEEYSRLSPKIRDLYKEIRQRLETRTAFFLSTAELRTVPRETWLMCHATGIKISL